MDPEQSHQYNLAISKTRDQALELRVKVQVSHGKIKHCMRHLEESQEELMAAIRSLNLEATQDESLRSLEDRFKGDSNNLKAAMEELRAVHQSLSGLDYELFSEEQKLHGARNSMDRLLAPDQVPPSTVETVTVTANISHDEIPLPPLLEEYFDALGDSKLLRERLEFDLPTEHDEKRQERERLRDQADSISLGDESDEQFELSLAKERKDLEVRLEGTNKKAAELFERCLKSGLDPDPTSYARHSDDGSSSTENQNKVERWLGDVGDVDKRSDDAMSRDDDSWSTQGPASPVGSPPATSYIAHAGSLFAQDDRSKPIPILNTDKMADTVLDREEISFDHFSGHEAVGSDI